MTDPVWWFYLYWSGAFLHDKFGADLVGVAAASWFTFMCLADVKAFDRGRMALVRRSFKRGWSARQCREKDRYVAFAPAFVTARDFRASLVPAGMTMAAGLWIAATFIGVAHALAAHQGFSANIFTTASDMFPKRAVSSITGLGGLAGALGGVILQSVAGVTIELTGGNYLPLFIVVAACAYPVAIVWIQLFAPRLEFPPATSGTGNHANAARRLYRVVFSRCWALPLWWPFRSPTIVPEQDRSLSSVRS